MTFESDMVAKSKTAIVTEVGKTAFLNLRRSNCDDIKTPRAKLLFGVVFRCFYSAWRHVRFRRPHAPHRWPGEFIICFIGPAAMTLTIKRWLKERR